METRGDHRLIEPVDGNPWDIDAYISVGGYEAWKKCLRTLSPEQIIEELKLSKLRGRGGAGYPTAAKWDAVTNASDGERYFVCNAGEHEPGTFKDRYLLQTIPHQLIEGCLIASRAARATRSYIYVNHEYREETERLKMALGQARAWGLVGPNVMGSGVSIDLQILEGHGSYVAGEETAMLEAIQGRPALPREKPPYPTDIGLYGKPTLVNNVETLCNVPRIIRKGAAWFTQVGTEQCPGTMMFSLSGSVMRPGVYEMPMGTSIRELIERCGGGPLPGRTVKAVFPGGPAFAMVKADKLDLSMDFDSLKKAGSGLGSAGVIVIDDATCIVRTVLEFSTFFKNESCGQCAPCRTGTEQMAVAMTKLEAGQGTEEDMKSLLELCGMVKGTGYCTLVTGAARLVQSAVKHFRAEFEEHARLGRCPYPTS